MALRESLAEIPLVESTEPVEGPVDNIIRMSKPGAKPKKVESPFGRNLKALLAAKKISQAQCCAMTGIARATLNQWLYASGVPRNLTLAWRCVRLLEPTLDSADFLEMLGLEPVKTRAAPIPAEDLGPDLEIDPHADPDFEGLFFVSMRRVRRKKPSGSEVK